MEYITEGHSLPSSSCADGRKRNVCYYYDSGIANVDCRAQHVMVPRRVAMTHALVASYGLLPDMTRLRTTPATQDDLRAFHDDAYVGLLHDVTPDAYYRRRVSDLPASTTPATSTTDTVGPTRRPNRLKRLPARLAC